MSLRLRQLIVNYCDDISEEEMNAIVELAESKNLERNCFLSGGNHGEGKVILVESGALRCFELFEGIERVIHLSTSGNIFLDFGNFESSNKRWLIQAICSSEIITIQYSNLFELCKVSRAAREFVVNLLCETVSSIMWQRMIFSDFTGLERIGQLKKIYPEWYERFTRKDLSSFIGITPESLSRCVNKGF